MFDLRYYQTEAIDAVYDYWEKDHEGSALIEMATGTGKAFVIAKLVQMIFDAAPHARILQLVHVRELVRQNVQELIKLWPAAPVGINSAGLGRRDVRHPVLCASVQSVYKYAHAIGHRDIVIIDEAHLVAASGDGMYRKLLEDMRSINPNLRVVGLTATPYRLDSGRLDTGPGKMFDKIVYEYGVGKGVADGFLSPLTSKGMATEIDVSGVAKRGGEFIAGALEAAADVDAITQAAVNEIISFGQSRRSWLVFCSGVKHAGHVRDAMRARGVSCETVTGTTPKDERDAILNAFVAGRIRCVTNMSVLTTGFNAPGVDLIAMLRPTLSTGLYVQMLGRGTRKASGKENCLVLDFSGNVRRHGAVDDLSIADKKPRGDGQIAAIGVNDVKLVPCPHCQTYISPRANTCPECNEVVRDEPKHEARADNVAVMTGRASPEDWRQVYSQLPSIHRSGWEKPPTLRVDYNCGGARNYTEWLCFDHEVNSFPRRKASSWWIEQGGKLPVPASVQEAYKRYQECRAVDAIKVRKDDGKYERIFARRFAATQERLIG